MGNQKKIILLELNEFNAALLEKAGRELGLQNIQDVLSAPKTDTFTRDTYESNFLEPWVQWVSVHTGKASARHQIKHLGDVPHLGIPQLWETLSQYGITSGIWGVMNGSRGSASQCKFFFPDPWTASEPGFPSELSKTLELPRLLSKNYLNLPWLQVFKKSVSFIRALFRSGAVGGLLSQLPGLVLDLISHGPKHYVFIAHMDLLAARLYIRYYRKYSPDFGILFVNCIAHVQHHHWNSSVPLSKNRALAFTFRRVDQIIELLKSAVPLGGELLVLNGLSQKNTNDEPDWLLYRPKDHAGFLRAIGVTFDSAEPHMTYDAHVFFGTEKERDQAVQILKSVHVRGRPIFLVETYSEDPKKIFYRVDFSERVDSGERFQVGEKFFRFSDHFEAIVVRTGKHIPNGNIYGKIEGMPNRIENHEVYDWILSRYGISRAMAETVRP